MTVQSTTIRVSYSGDGSSTAFPVTYKFLDNSHLVVRVRAANGTETVKVLNTDYTVTGAGNPSGGTVTFLSAPASGTTVVITRTAVPLTQTADYTPNDPFPAETHEGALDKQVMIAQELNEAIGRSVKFPATDSASLSAELPASATRANKALVFDASGNVGVSEDDYNDQLADVTAQATAAAASASAAASSAASASGSAASAASSATAAANSETDAEYWATLAAARSSIAINTQSFTVSGGTITINNSGYSADQLEVSVGGVLQQPTADYTVSGTTLTWQGTPPPDGTTGFIRYLAKQADVGMFVQAGTGAVARTMQDKQREVVSVKDFGAVGDGITDDTAAIQNAVDVARRVLFPSGTYNITNIDLPANTALCGDGGNTTISITSAASTAGINAIDQDNITIEGLRIVGTGEWTSTPFPNPAGGGDSVGFNSLARGINLRAINVAKIYNISITNCYINGFYYGIRVKDVDGLVVKHCKLENHGQAAVRLETCDNPEILNNIIDQVDGNTTSPGDTDPNNSIFADAIYLMDCVNAVVAHNKINDIRRIGIVLERDWSNVSARLCQNCLISHNVISNVTGHRLPELNAGIWLEGMSHNATSTVANNIIYNDTPTTDFGIKGIYAVDANQVSGNTIYNLGVGIHGNNGNFANNVITNCTEGIYLYQTASNEQLGTYNYFNVIGNRISEFVNGIHNPNPTDQDASYSISQNILTSSSSAGYPLRVYQVGSTSEISCKIQDNTIDDVSCTAGAIEIACPTLTINMDTICSGNLITRATGYGIYCINTPRIVVARNLIKSPSLTGIFFSNNGTSTYQTNARILDNTVTEAGGHGILVRVNSGIGNRYANYEVAGNSVTLCGQNGIAISGSGNNAIIGYAIASRNRCEDNGQSVSTNPNTKCGIWAYPSSGLTLTIVDNVLVSSAAANATTGQIYGCYEVYSGDQKLSDIRNNQFIFTASLSSWPVCLAEAPYTIAGNDGSSGGSVTPREVVYALGNYSTKRTVAKGFFDLPSDGDAVSGQTYLGFRNAAPGPGTFKVGDYFLNSAPTAGGYLGWICTTAGSPGTWKGFGAIQA